MTDKEGEILRALVKLHRETYRLLEQIEDALDAAAGVIAHAAIQNLEETLEEEID